MDETDLTQERLEMEISYRAPELLINKLVAGARYQPATFNSSAK